MTFSISPAFFLCYFVMEIEERDWESHGQDRMSLAKLMISDGMCLLKGFRLPLILYKLSDISYCKILIGKLYKL